MSTPAPPGNIRPGILRFSGADGQVAWTGVELTDDVMADLLSGPLQERLGDQASRDAALAELRALASTEMASDVIDELLATEAQPLPWEVGEALAEVLLAEWHAVVWVWNTARDRRTRLASLPGADLVGLTLADGQAALLFGEVKSSSDTDVPPNVLYGKSGMVKQLEHLAQTTEHWTLIKWLRARCLTPEHVQLYKEAVGRYLASGAKDLSLVGCLIRDTPPEEGDVSGRASALALEVVAPMRAMLNAWYVPIAMAGWPDAVGLANSA